MHHAPTGEDWMLAADERRGKVVAAGWPESIAEASDCTLIRVGSDEGRIAMLKLVAAQGSMRGDWARDDLRLAGIEAPPLAQGRLF